MPLSDQQLAQIYAASFPEAAHHFSAESFAEFKKDKLTQIYYAPHGALIARLIADEAEIITFFIAPQHQNQGEATQILHAFLQNCKAQNIQNIHLEVAKDNKTALTFYQKFGFTPQGVRKNYYKRQNGEKIDAILLRK